MCSGILSNRARHHAFTFVNKKTNRPLNLAAETAEQMNSWITVIEEATHQPKNAQGRIHHKEG